ncbi:MAG TPA: selenocysteine-specific translation elongation factor, partial [Planctomycetes bacterium]|nr:selenocysteine-specific translation elongation factor [Planctomycetota bacterium]
MTEIKPIPVVVGTAGHIDHGKSALVEALCGEHPDRWAEEKERGITLDLGYAQLAWDDGLEVGFVDVPGHERLVRKMVAGATGMGAALLVVACDDGVMPQTREHFEVLKVMGVRRGLVVLNKVDLVDIETVNLVREEVMEMIAGTPWGECQLIPASAKTGEGLDEVRTAIRELVEGVTAKDESNQIFRLPVQRSFALHGAGTVATGVSVAGVLAEGEKVMVLPGNKITRVRRIQVHGREAGCAFPGFRTALNLPDFRPADCPRGSVLVPPNGLEAGSLLRAAITFLPGSPHLKSGSLVHVLAGTAAVPAQLFLPPERPEEGPYLADLELSASVALAAGDRLLIRRPSPARNLASGRFLGFAVRRLKSKDEIERSALSELLMSLEDPVALAAALLGWLAKPCHLGELASKLGRTEEGVLSALESARSIDLVQNLDDGRWIAIQGADAAGEQIRIALEGFKESCPHRTAIPVEVLRARLGQETFDVVSEMEASGLAELGLIRQAGKSWELADVEIPENIAREGDVLLEFLTTSGLSPGGVKELADQCQVSEDRILVLLEYLNDQKEILSPGKGIWFATCNVENLRDAVVEQLGRDGVDIPALRDRFSTTRKFMMPL